MSQDADDVPAHALRLSPQAQRDIGEAALRLATLAQDPEVGERWGEALYDELAKLATLPGRVDVAEKETRLFGRQMVYRQSPSSVAYLVFFSLTEEGEDGPTLNVSYPARQQEADDPHRSAADTGEPMTAQVQNRTK